MTTSSLMSTHAHGAPGSDPNGEESYDDYQGSLKIAGLPVQM
jgi:hypothetical protein